MNKDILKSFIKKYWEIFFFIIGFAFDIFTLGDIDDGFNIVQQIFYLFAGFVFLIFQYRKNVQLKIPKFFIEKWKYVTYGYHFIIGSLLSSYTIFFFKSSSFQTSFFFLSFIVGLLILNELPQGKSYKHLFRLLLFSVCVHCFFSYSIPLLAGYISTTLFIISLLVSSTTLFFLVIILNLSQISIRELNQKILFPNLCVTIFFLFSYLGRIMPPVPLAIVKSGIYRNVEKEDGKYYASYKNSWWKFWSKGEQVFHHEDGDKVYIIFTIFSPAEFSETVSIKWFNNRNGVWINTDKIKVPIKGGRRNGYRTYTYKSNINEGSWYATVNTNDQREIGRIYFSIRKSKSSKPLRVDIY